MPKGKVSDINSIIKTYANHKKATGPDAVPPKLLKMSSNLIDSHFCNAVNYNTEDKSFPRQCKNSFSTSYMQEEITRHKIENYSYISIFNMT